jgi:hypothetical protein
MARYRFVDFEGRSFFKDLQDGLRECIRLFAPDEDLLDNTGANLRVRRDVYVREVWFVPVGPLACPLGDPGEQFDAVYKYDSTEMP